MHGLPFCRARGHERRTAQCTLPKMKKPGVLPSSCAPLRGRGWRLCDRLLRLASRRFDFFPNVTASWILKAVGRLKFVLQLIVDQAFNGAPNIIIGPSTDEVCPLRCFKVLRDKHGRFPAHHRNVTQIIQGQMLQTMHGNDGSCVELIAQQCQ